MAAEIGGYVDSSTLSPIVKIKLIPSSNIQIDLPAIIDTGFNGELILPEYRVREMGLELLGTIDSELADGQVVEMELFSGRINWFGTVRDVAVGASRSEDALLGTLLLADCELKVNFREGWVRIERL